MAHGEEVNQMYGPAGKVAGGAAATLPVTGFTSGTGILFMIVLGTVLIALGVALTRFIPRRQLLSLPGRGDCSPRPGGYERKGYERHQAHPCAADRRVGHRGGGPHVGRSDGFVGHR